MDRTNDPCEHGSRMQQETWGGDNANHYLQPNGIYWGDARDLVPHIEPNSIALSMWSPPYWVGKTYESHLSFDDWQSLLATVIRLHGPIIKPGGFVVINIADILVFNDPAMPRIRADVVHRKRTPVTREDIVNAMAAHPTYSRRQLAQLLGCSEQTIDRRLKGNNARGRKSETQTRVKLVGGLIEQWAEAAGFYLYDRRIWVKDPAWTNARWTQLSYRSVDEFEYLYFLWKPGVTTIDRTRLSAEEWSDWGARGVWRLPSVRANDDHEAKFPVALPTRVIRLLTEPKDIVLDCFIGSGTTAVAAVREHRRYIGIEREAAYVALARHRVATMQ